MQNDDHQVVAEVALKIEECRGIVEAELIGAAWIALQLCFVTGWVGRKQVSPFKMTNMNLQSLQHLFDVVLAVKGCRGYKEQGVSYLS